MHCQHPVGTLPSRVYERHGVRVYSIGYKRPDGTWAFRLRCDVSDQEEIAALREEAAYRATGDQQDCLHSKTFTTVAKHWLSWQKTLPRDSAEKRADSTLEENEREIAQLNRAFGRRRVTALTKVDAYTYLRDSQSKGRSAKGNKEIALARLILEYAITLGILAGNPFDRVKKSKTKRTARLVTDNEMDLTVRAGRQMGGQYLVVALALKTAWLCLRRSVEVRALQVQQINEQGISWKAGKIRRSDVPIVGLIHWSAELKATIGEALSLRGPDPSQECFVFGTSTGERYTKGGWKTMLHKLMVKAKALADEENVPFQRFSLQDCRPKGITDKLASGHDDVMDATLHSSERMIREVYDRRRVREATPAR